MRNRLLIAAVASSLLAVLGSGVAGAAPTPKYTVTCAIAGSTIASWQRASLSDVTFDWSAPNATYTSVSSPVAARPPKGMVTVGTPLVPTPATATVTFTPADGSQPAVITVDCT